MRFSPVQTMKHESLSSSQRLAAILKILHQHHVTQGMDPVKMREIIDKPIFGTPTLYPFENLYLQGAERYDAYLSALYADYMQLPPEDKQITHADEFYVEEEWVLQ